MTAISLAIIILMTLLFTSCSKEHEWNFSGQWAGGPDLFDVKNMVYTGYFSDTTTVMRTIKGVNDHIEIIMYGAPNIKVVANQIDNKLYCSDYEVETSAITSCPKTKIKYHNIIMELKNDSLIETGEYSVCFDNEVISYKNNFYIAKFIKRN